MSYDPDPDVFVAVEEEAEEEEEEVGGGFGGDADVEDERLDVVADAGVFVAGCEDGDNEDAAETGDATEADINDVGGVDGDARSFETSYWMAVPSSEDVSKC